MRIARFIGTSTLFMLLAGSVTVYAQDRQEQKESPEPKPETSAPAGRSPEEMKAPKQDEAKPGKQESTRQLLEAALNFNTVVTPLTLSTFGQPIGPIATIATSTTSTENISCSISGTLEFD